jgi:hypothetical protein
MSSTEQRLLPLASIATVLFLAPFCSWDIYFFGQMAFVLVPQVFMVASLKFWGARPAAIVGAMAASNIYFIAFYFLESRIENDNGLFWLSYFLTGPCGIIGAYIAITSKNISKASVIAASGTLFVATIVASIASQFLLCTTFLRCLG